MPLSPPALRESIHQRRYRFEGYRRADGRWEIEGHLTDTKSYRFHNQWRGEIAPGTPIHDMSIRLTLDDDLVVHDIEVVTDAAPFQICPHILPNFVAVKGLRVGPGWQRAIRQRLGGVHGCTHQVELLGAMATVAYQTIFPSRRQAEGDGGSTPPRSRPGFIDSCHALASDSPVVRRFWPEFYSGE